MYSVFYDMHYTLYKFHILGENLKPVLIISLCDKAVGLAVKTTLMPNVWLFTFKNIAINTRQEY